MPQFIRGYCDRAIHKNEPGAPIRFIASTEKTGRDGLILDSRGWQLENFQRSPTVLWSHDYSGQRPPIGRADKVWVEDGQLLCDISFDQNDPFAVSVEYKYRNNFLSAVSVGWETLETEPGKNGSPTRVIKQELLDISAVNIPGDPNALMERQKRAVSETLIDKLTLAVDDPDKFLESLQRSLVDDAEPKPESATWEQVAADMLRLYASTAQRPDTERQREYRRLSRDYARHGKTAPEWMPLHDLEVLSTDEIRGLFLQGEGDGFEWVHSSPPEVRAGAVLSKRNADDLATAITLITGVMERATKEPVSEPEPTDDTLERLYAAFKEKTQ